MEQRADRILPHRSTTIIPHSPHTSHPHVRPLFSTCSLRASVLLQPLEQEPPAHAKCKDKFMVASAYISPDEEMKTLAEMVSTSALIEIQLSV